MRHSRIRLLFSVFVIVAATLLLSAGKASAQSTFTCGKWNHVSDPVPGMGQSLYGVAGSSVNDIWAVGRRNLIKNPNYYVPLMQHWNGTSWSIVKLPATPEDTQLYDVAVISSTDAWAVGDGYTAGTLTFHWGGTQWSSIPNPQNVGTLVSVSAIATNNVWAVGYGNGTTLTEHWDGTQWSVIPSPNVGTFSDLVSVSADATNDVWAVGIDHQNGDEFALVEHWNGTQWNIMNVPQPSATGNYFGSVTAIAPDDVWAVGWYDPENSLTEHWDGSQWTVISSPDPGNYAQLAAVTAVSSTDVWAVGNSGAPGSFTMQWNGTQWNTIHDPYPKNHVDSLDAITALPNNQGIWAVGSTSDDNNINKLITEYYC